MAWTNWLSVGHSRWTKAKEAYDNIQSERFATVKLILLLRPYQKSQVFWSKQVTNR